MIHNEKYLNITEKDMNEFIYKIFNKYRNYINN